MQMRRPAWASDEADEEVFRSSARTPRQDWFPSPRGGRVACRVPSLRANSLGSERFWSRTGA
eukprot:8259988-Lingulodinium_polyedra.AAC.1